MSPLLPERQGAGSTPRTTSGPTEASTQSLVPPTFSWYHWPAHRNPPLDVHRVLHSIMATMLALTAAAHAQDSSQGADEQEALLILLQNGLITQEEYDQRTNSPLASTTDENKAQTAPEQSHRPQEITDHSDGGAVTPKTPVLGTRARSLSGFRKGNYIRGSGGNGEFQQSPEFLRPTSKGTAVHVEGMLELTDRWFGFGQYDWFNDPDDVVYDKTVIGIGWGRPVSAASEADIRLGFSLSGLEYSIPAGPLVNTNTEEFVIGVGYRHFFGDRLLVEPRITASADDKELTLRVEWDTGWRFDVYGQGLYRDDYSSILLGTSVYF